MTTLLTLRKNRSNKGFSIVELLVVIIIIGILATLVVVGYNAVVSQTKATALKSDLRLAVDSLAIVNEKKGKYPTSLAGITLGASNNTSYQYSYIPDERTFCLTASNGTLVFHALDKGLIMDGPCPGYTASAPTVSTLAGSTAGFANNTGSAAQFNGPLGLTIAPTGDIYVADNLNHQIRRVTQAGVVSTFAGSTTPGLVNLSGTSARFDSPMGIVRVSNGDFYVTDTQNDVIRRITSAAAVSTYAGSGTTGFSNGQGTTSAVRFNFPTGIAADSSGNLYVADLSNHDIRLIANGTVLVSTYAGNSPGTPGFGNGTGSNVYYNYPFEVAVDSSGAVYVADRDNNQIRKSIGGVTSTFAGSTTSGFGDGTSGTARFNKPTGLAIDSSGNLYVADTGNNAIRKITPAGVVTTIAGGSVGTTDGSGSTAQFNQPYGIAVDTSGNIYVSDSGNHRIRKITQ